MVHNSSFFMLAERDRPAKNEIHRDLRMCRDYSGLPLPKGEEAAKQDMALPCCSLRSMP